MYISASVNYKAHSQRGAIRIFAMLQETHASERINRSSRIKMQVSFYRQDCSICSVKALESDGSTYFLHNGRSARSCC